MFKSFKNKLKKNVKPRSYIASHKIWLNSKYIKTKQNRKLETKFLGPFRILYFLRKKTYKLELPRKWKIYNVFHVLLRKQDITKKKRVDNNIRKLNAGNNGKEYKIKAIWNSIVYLMESESGYLSKLFYLVV